MSVYVSTMKVSIKSKQWPYSHYCYLIADSVDELHQFAVGLGLKREWFQAKSMPHYDLVFGMRAAVRRAGAIEIDDKEIVNRLRKHRNERNFDSV